MNHFFYEMNIILLEHTFSVKCVCLHLRFTWWVKQACKRPIETDADLHVVILTLCFNVCIHENQKNTFDIMCDIKYYTITDHTKLKECLYNSSLKYCCWFPWYRRQQQTDNKIKVSSSDFQQKPNLSYTNTTPLIPV